MIDAKLDTDIIIVSNYPPDPSKNIDQWEDDDFINIYNVPKPFEKLRFYT
jgi:hypothetical protein